MKKIIVFFNSANRDLQRFNEKGSTLFEDHSTIERGRDSSCYTITSWIRRTYEKCVD